MKTKLNPFTTSRRYACCPNCGKGFDPSSGYDYPLGILPDDCDGVVERVVCGGCKREDGRIRPIAAWVIGSVLIGIGLLIITGGVITNL